MILGTGQATITPPLGTPLAGYGRERAVEAVADDLELQAFWFQPGETSLASEAVCLITADIIGFGGDTGRAIRSDLMERFGLSGNAIMLAASHTHSGPQTLDGLAAAGGLPVPGYVAALREQASAAVAQARDSIRAVTVYAGRGRLSGFAINRRVAAPGGAEMRPNPNGPRDDEVTVVSMRDSGDQSLVAALFHYTCHPTVMGDTRVSGDYPGSARRHAVEALPGVAVGFLPGCFGDVRPNCTLLGGRTFRSGGPEDVGEFGAALGAEVARVAQVASEPLSPSLRAALDTLQLPLAKEPLTSPMPIQRLDLADRVTLIGMGGEICVDYGLFIKSLRPGAFMVPMGYTNEVVTYVASERMFPEGGYEVDGAWPWFGQPSAFKPSVEAVIHDAIRRLLAA